MLKFKKIITWRTRYWLLFSSIFFLQFLLGLLVNDKFLMTGKLHLPIPALIIAGPIYRGGGFFMLILLLSTILFVGPAWCSHLCYIGAWDNLAAKIKKEPKMLKRKTTLKIRYSMILFVTLAAFLLNVLGQSGLVAFIVATAFGSIGIGVMIFLSRKFGYMVHCTTFCPIGGLVVFLAKYFPVRVKIDTNSCTLCNKCTMDCKYDALRITDVKNGKAGWNCTLCGDCLNSCNFNSIRFSFFGREKNIWEIYIAVVVGIHAVFIALARL
jgi:polyferredoxin